MGNILLGSVIFLNAGVDGINGSVGEYIGGVFIGLGILVAAYALVMALYVMLKKKFSYKKYKVEILTVALVISISIVFKLIAYSLSCGVEYKLGDGVLSFFEAIYGGIGGLTFEGLGNLEFVPGVKECAIAAINCCYVGSTLLSGLVILSVITAKASYEIYSFIRLLFPEKNCDIYVFMALTDETLILADSIRRKQEDKYIDWRNNYKGRIKEAKQKIKCEFKQVIGKKDCKEKQERKERIQKAKQELKDLKRLNRCYSKFGKVKKYRIVFAGSTLDAFDRKDERCREVVSKNYYYWSCLNNSKQHLAQFIHLNNKNYDDYEKRFVVFAFDSENHIPNEENNMDFVFKDIDARITILGKKAKKKDPQKFLEQFHDTLRIEYYILTKRDINYEAYQEEIDFYNDKYYDAFEEAYCNRYGYKPKEKAGAEIIKKYFAKMFVVNVWAESETIANTVAHFIKNYRDFKFAIPDDKSTRVWALGYGTTAEAICKELYVQSANIDGEGKVAEFRVDAFDPKAREIIGLCAKQEPMSIYVENRKGVEGEIEEKKKAICYSQASTIFNKYSTSKSFVDIELSCLNETSPYTVCFNAKSALEYDTLDQVDEVTGVVNSDNGKSRPRPQYIVVSTNDDYLNIKITNALVMDIIKEKVPDKPQVIFVVIHDEKNNRLLNEITPTNGTDCDNAYRVIEYAPEKKLYVVVIGNNDKIYSYKEIVDYSEPVEYKNNYDRIAASIGLSGDEALRKVEGYIHNYANGGKVTENEYIDVYECAMLYKTFCRKNLEDYNEYREALEKAIKSNPNSKVLKMMSTHTIDEEFFSNLNANKYCAWQADTLWKRKSNVSANRYSTTFKKMWGKLDLDNKTLTPEEGAMRIVKLLKLEHARWMRLHMAYGWSLNVDGKDESRREHNCIVPEAYVPSDTLRYDLINVLWEASSSDKNEVVENTQIEAKKLTEK